VVPERDITVWRGEVRIENDLTLPRGSRLVVEPGARIGFAFRDEDNDGWGDLALRVEGDLIARGTPEAPIDCVIKNLQYQSTAASLKCLVNEHLEPVQHQSFL